MANRWGKNGNSGRFQMEIVADFISRDLKSLWMATAAMKLKDAFP